MNAENVVVAVVVGGIALAVYLAGRAGPAGEGKAALFAAEDKAAIVTADGAVIAAKSAGILRDQANFLGTIFERVEWSAFADPDNARDLRERIVATSSVLRHGADQLESLATKTAS